MAALGNERVINVHHWNDTLFSFRTTRDQSLRFEIPDGPLTSRLQHLKEGDSLIVSRKPVGTLAMLKSLTNLLDAHGFQASPQLGMSGDYVIERAFVEK